MVAAGQVRVLVGEQDPPLRRIERTE